MFFETLEYFSLKLVTMWIENCASGNLCLIKRARVWSIASPATSCVRWSSGPGIVPWTRQRSVVPAPMSITSVSSRKSRP